MQERKFEAWSVTECDNCGNEFQVTRTKAKTITGRVICGDCETYETARKEGFEGGVKASKKVLVSLVQKVCYENGYAIEAVPKAVLLGLENLVKLTT